MAHTILNTSAMASENIDRDNAVGIYANGDIDNGTLVLLGTMNLDTTTKKILGYEYNVTLAGAGAAKGADLWIVATPEVMPGAENIYNDKANFYNKAGRPMAIHRVSVGDMIELTAEAFTTNDFPETSEVGYYVPTAANGKFGTPVSSAPTGSAFLVEGLTDISRGNNVVAGVLLRRVQ